MKGWEEMKMDSGGEEQKSERGKEGGDWRGERWRRSYIREELLRKLRLLLDGDVLDIPRKNLQEGSIGLHE